MKKQHIYSLITILAIALIVFTFVSEKTLFSDVPQYVAVGKEFAGLSIAKVRNTPGWLYGWFLGQFLKVSPSVATLKILNLIWFSITVIFLYKITKKLEVFLLYLSSPVVWFLSPWINPLPLISLLFLTAYYFLKKDNIKGIIIAGLVLGLATAIWWAAFYFSVFFLLAFLYNKRFYEVLIAIVSFLLTFSLRIIFDLYYFSLPFFSTVRSLGSNLSFLIGDAPGGLPEHNFLKYFLILVIITPLLYKLYFIEWKKEIPSLIFLILSLILFLFNFQLRFFLAITPIVILLIVPKVKIKEILISLVISIIVIASLTASYIPHKDTLITADLKEIANDLPNERFIVGSKQESEEVASYLDVLYEGNKIKELIRFTEYSLWEKDKNLFRTYEFESKSKINNLRKVRFSIDYLKTPSNYNNVNYWR